MAATYQALLVVHVFAAMTWFGMGLGLSRRLRLGLLRGRGAAVDAAAEVRRAGTISLVFGAAAIATGVTLVLVGGGYAVYARRIHWGQGLAFVAFVLGLFVVRPAWAKVAVVAAGDGPLDPAFPLARRAAVVQGVVQLLQIATLALMTWRIW